MHQGLIQSLGLLFDRGLGLRAELELRDVRLQVFVAASLKCFGLVGATDHAVDQSCGLWALWVLTTKSSRLLLKVS